MKVWILGGTGMLGQALCRVMSGAQLDFVATNKQTDVTQPHVLQAFAAAHPGITHVINCAAYTQVDACQEHSALALAVNSDGPRHVGQVAQQLGAPALHVSSDYVFAGDATEPYVEMAPCAPLGIYGHTKRLGERGFVTSGEDRYVVRTSWLFGQDGGNFVATMLRLMSQRKCIEVVADQVGRPTYCDDLAAALLGLMGLARPLPAAPPGIYHFANSGSTSWHGFAQAIWQHGRRAGRPLICEQVAAVPTSAYPTAARRPAYSVLSTDKAAQALRQAPRSWQEALDDYLRATATQLRA